MAAGEIPLAVSSSSSVIPYIKNGRVSVLAVTMANRSRLNPEWPTLQEAGIADVDASLWTGLIVPKKTPQPIVDKLNSAVVEILKMSEIKDRFAALGIETIPSTPAEFGVRLQQDTEHFGVIVRNAGIKPD